MEKRINLDNMGRAFAYAVWGFNLKTWPQARTRLQRSSDPIARHLGQYPTRGMVSMVECEPIARAVTRRDPQAFAKAVVWNNRKIPKATPVDALAKRASAVDLANIEESIALARTAVAIVSGKPIIAPPESVATYAANYSGPKGKVEAAAEKFGLTIPEAAKAVRGETQQVEIPGLDELDALRAEVAALRRENRALRTLMTSYMPTGDLG